MSKTLHYNFAADKSLAARIGPTLGIVRASEATYRDSAGVLQTAAANEARFDHDVDGNSLGLLVEEARTNLFKHSNDFTNAVWASKAAISLTPDAVTAPNYASGGGTKVVWASSGDASMEQAYNNGSTLSGWYCLSFWAMAVSVAATVSIRIHSDTYDEASASSFTTIQPGVWTRISLVHEFTTTTRPVVKAGFEYNGQNWNQQLYVADMQLEKGAFPTSYIPTTTAAVTRAVDNVSTADLSWLDESAGTFYGAMSVPHFNVVSGVWMILSDGSVVDRHTLFSSSSNQNMTYEVKNGSVTQANLVASSVWSEGVTLRHAASYAANDFESYIDAARTGTGDQSGTPPTGLTELQIGAYYNNALPFNGHIAEIAYYDERLSNVQLEAMSLGNFPDSPPYIAITRRTLNGPPKKRIYPKPTRGLFR